MGSLSEATAAANSAYASSKPASQPAPAVRPSMTGVPVQAAPRGNGYVSVFDRAWTDNEGYSSIFDRFWTDDFSAIPVIGPAASWAGDQYTKSTEGISTILSTGLLAANQKYWENRGDAGNLMQDASRVSPGRAAVALGVKDPTTAALAGAVNLGATALGNDAPFKDVYQDDPNFNIADDWARDAKFENNQFLKFESGLVDAAATWFLDPLVIVGKGVKVFRFGSQALGKIPALSGTVLESGVLNRSLASPEMVKRVGDEADTAMKFVDEGSTSDNMIGTIADEVVRGDFVALRKLPQFQNQNRDILAGIGAGITDKRDAIVFLAAAAGNQKYIRALHNLHMEAYDALRRAKTTNVYERAAAAAKPGEYRKPFYDDLLEPDIKADALMADMVKRNAALAKAVGEIDDGTQLLDRIGMVDNPLAVRGAKIAAAWRATGRGGSSRLDMPGKPGTGSAPAVFETVFQKGGMFRRMAVWDWLGGYHASGTIAVRGPDVGKASDEMLAALTDSRYLRKNRDMVDSMMNRFGMAVAEGKDKFEAVQRIEKDVAEAMAKHYGVSDGAWQDIYARIDRMRDDTIKQFQSRGYVVELDGTLVRGTPRLISQLETHMPMLNMNMLEQSMKIAAKGDAHNWSRKNSIWGWTNAGKNTVDEIQSLWKASVLLRLGYTQRNVLEGWLRTAAVLGTVPALTSAGKGLKNAAYNWSRAGRRQYAKSLRKQEEDLSKKIAQTRKEISDLKNPAEVALREPELKALFASLDDVVAARRNLASRRYIGSEPGGAFAGELGDLYRREASGYQTVDNFLESEWMRQAGMQMNNNAWVKITPDAKQYWEELAGAVRQFRNDDVALMALQGKSVDEIVKWLNSSAGRSYRQTFHLSHTDAPQHVTEVSEMVYRYLPTDEARALAAAGQPEAADLMKVLGGLAKKNPPKKPDPSNARFVDEATGMLDGAKYNDALARYKQKMTEYEATPGLSAIHGREVSQVIADRTTMQIANAQINKLFRALGARPEAALVRAPFYNTVWTREFNRLQTVALGQGVDLTDDVLKQINKLSHRKAMRATNETLYTIERMSNVGSAMRWIAPFFPAWENSMKVWFKIITDDPSVLARANILWNLPNNLGMVVDENGKPVGRENFSFLSGSQNRFIILPTAINDTLMKFNGGVPIKVAQGAVNVVTPGETPYLPGIGPMAAIPVGQFLSTRPDWQAYIRDNAPAVWQQIAPLGEVQTLGSAAPAWMRKSWRLFRGEADVEYLQVVDSMIASAMVDWALADYDPELKPNYDDIIKQAQQFHLFSIGASLGLPFSTTRMSKYQDKADAWRAMQADNSSTYREKIDKFVTKYGLEFLPMTTSTSEYVAGSVSPDMNTWNLLTDNEALIRDVAALDPSAVGVLAATSPRGEFDLGVYNALGEMVVPNTNDVYRYRKSPQEMLQSVELQKAWREYNIVKGMRDQALADAGISSIQSADAAGIKYAWDQFTDVYMVDKYGATWTVAYQSWRDKTPIYLEAIGMALQNQAFMEQNGNTPLWDGIRQYMSMRQQAAAAVASGQISGAEANRVMSAWAASWKDSNLQFSDFYDNYLENDDVSLAVAYL